MKRLALLFALLVPTVSSPLAGGAQPSKAAPAGSPALVATTQADGTGKLAITGGNIRFEPTANGQYRVKIWFNGDPCPQPIDWGFLTPNVPGPNPPVPPNPEPGPQPEPQPEPTPPTVGPIYAMVIVESADQTPAIAKVIGSKAVRDYLSGKGYKALRVVDKDVVDESGKPPADLVAPLQWAAGKPLPFLIVCDKAGKVLTASPLPPTEAEFLALLKKLGGV